MDDASPEKVEIGSVTKKNHTRKCLTRKSFPLLRCRVFRALCSEFERRSCNIIITYNELKRGKNSILAGQCTVCLKG